MAFVVIKLFLKTREPNFLKDRGNFFRTPITWVIQVGLKKCNINKAEVSDNNGN